MSARRACLRRENGGEVTLGTPAAWIAFLTCIAVMLGLDLAVFHRKAHEVRFREAIGWTSVWVALSLGFALAIGYFAGHGPALRFLTAWLIEKALSLDNVFVFVVTMSWFAVPKALQHRVLFWGILGALVMRAVFIFAGVALIHRFHWLLYVFGAFLVYTAVKLLTHRDTPEPGKNPVLRFAKRHLPTTTDYRDGRFLVREGGKWLATPLLLVLITIEATDLVFALDSIPAIFAVTDDPFILFTSNIFAILGLRALYFVLAGVMTKFCYLEVGLALVLFFVGLKMLLGAFVEVPIGISLGVVAALLGGSIVASLLRRDREDLAA
jgi:tellurite resistance protein TerC